MLSGIGVIVALLRCLNKSNKKRFEIPFFSFSYSFCFSPVFFYLLTSSILKFSSFQYNVHHLLVFSELLHLSFAYFDSYYCALHKYSLNYPNYPHLLFFLCFYECHWCDWCAKSCIISLAVVGVFFIRGPWQSTSC